MGTIKVLIADSQGLMADALALCLSSCWAEFEVLERRPIDGLDAVESSVALNPDVILLDYWLDMEGPAAARLILARKPHAKILLLSWFHGPKEVEKALDSGAVGFIPKSVKVDQLADAIRRAHAGESPVLKGNLDKLIGEIHARDDYAVDVWERLSELTTREILVLKMLGQGKTVEQIAKELFVSMPTIRKHVHHTLKKVGVHSQLEAIAIARHFGLLQG